MKSAIAFLLLATVGHASAVPALNSPLGNGGVFAVDCARTVRKNLDPLVKPKQPGASHMHDFFGPKNVPDNATIATLASQPTSCSVATDRSAYWMPSLYSKGVLQEGDSLQAYYFLDKGAQAPPKGLAMLAGYPNLTKTEPYKGASYACGPESNYGQKLPPNCSADGWLMVQVDFPSCWNGKDLDTTDHRSHMAYPNSQGACPTTHKVRIARLVLFRNFNQYSGLLRNITLASGSAGGMHADFVSGWNAAAFNSLIKQCGSKDCGHLGSLP